MIKILSNIVYDETNGKNGELDLYLPDKENDRKILLFYIHGGGLEAGDKQDEEGIYAELAMMGYTVISPNYSLYPQAKFPDYINDVAKAVAWVFKNKNVCLTFEKMIIGGISAGSFISMMLHFDKRFLANVGVDESQIDGYIFDAGQPTTHFNVLRERGEDTASVRVDETAAIYYITDDYEINDRQKFLILVSDNDIPGRKSQNELLIDTMKSHGYSDECIDYRIIKGFGHAGYVHGLEGTTEYKGKKLHGYTEILDSFIKNEF